MSDCLIQFLPVAGLGGFYLVLRSSDRVGVVDVDLLTAV